MAFKDAYQEQLQAFAHQIDTELRELVNAYETAKWRGERQQMNRIEKQLEEHRELRDLFIGYVEAARQRGMGDQEILDEFITLVRRATAQK